MDLVRSRRLGIGSALDYLQKQMSRPEDESAFLEWRNNPVTLLMIDAMREISVTPPAGYIDTDDIGAQYGVSSMASFAASFFADPRVLFPQLFSGATPGDPRPLPEADYSTDAESLPGDGTVKGRS